MCTCMHVCSCIQIFATLWTVALQAPLSIEFFRKEYWSGLPFPTPKDLPDSGIKPASFAVVGGFFTTAPPAFSILQRKEKLLEYSCFVY